MDEWVDEGMQELRDGRMDWWLDAWLYRWVVKSKQVGEYLAIGHYFQHDSGVTKRTSWTHQGTPLLPGINPWHWFPL